MKTQCTFCHALYEVDEGAVGQKVECPQCAHGFVINRIEAPVTKAVPSGVAMPGRHLDISSDAAEVTMPGKREQKVDGRFAPGDVIMHRYKVLAELGQGGMGVVYKCFDEIAGVEIALKALPPELSHNTLEMEDIKENFQFVSKLVHQNIAISKNLEKDESNGSYYLIMECVEGEDLRRWIKRKRREGSLTLEMVLPIIRQVAAALDYAHKERIIHRDIKPGNIMINATGDVKVLDFGLAAQIHTSMTRVSMAYHGTSGTGPYMAPEQWRGKAQGAPADQYALAVMTYEMLAGNLPFEAFEPAVLREAVLKDHADPITGVSMAVNQALQKAMSKEPQKRFAGCVDFADALGNSSFAALRKKFQFKIHLPKKWNASYWMRPMQWVAHHKKIVIGVLLCLLLCGSSWFWIHRVFPKNSIKEKTSIKGNISVVEKIDIEAEEARARRDMKELGVRFSGDLTTLEKFPQNANVSKYKIPGCVVVIAKRAFEHCNNLQEVEIPHSVCKIEYRAFADCGNLTQIKLPESVAEIGPACFYKCTELRQVFLPEGLEEIPQECFLGCTKLQDIQIPSSVACLGYYSFCGSGLQTISIPDKVTIIGESCFNNCPWLYSVKLSNALTEIRRDTFRSCSRLQEINIPASVVSIGEHAFDNCTSLRKVEFHAGLQTIGGYAFCNCTSLRKVTLPSTLKIFNTNCYLDPFRDSPCKKDADQQWVQIQATRSFNLSR